MSLLVAPCDAKAAKHAVMHWHYSKAMPIGKLVRFGVWEDDRFIGAVMFGRGASPKLGAPFGCDQTQACELVRVALDTHRAPVTQIVALALDKLARSNPSMRLVISFADPFHNHIGGIYQAGNWLYLGTSAASTEVMYRGKWFHSRMLRPTGWGTHPVISRLSEQQRATLETRQRPGKHRYGYPLDKAMRRQLTRLSLPYPRG